MCRHLYFSIRHFLYTVYIPEVSRILVEVYVQCWYTSSQKVSPARKLVDGRHSGIKSKNLL